MENKKTERTLRSVFVLLWLLVNGTVATASQDSTQNRSWWLAYKLGTAQSNVSEFQRWCASQGVPGVSQFSRNTVIGFDVLHHRGRVTYGLSSDFELRTFGKTEPYFFTFALRAGYLWINTGRLQVRSLAGIGAGYALVRFETGTPASLQSISANYSDPFARASTLVSRLELLASGNLFANEKRKVANIQPIIFINAGVQPVLTHGAWSYGETEVDIDGNQFAGQRIDMPPFYRGNWFLTVGIAMGIVTKRPNY